MSTILWIGASNRSDVRTADPMVITLRGKGSKTRRVPLMDSTARLVTDYLHRKYEEPSNPTPASAPTPTHCSPAAGTPD